MWPKGPTIWRENRTLFASVPFTWNLPRVRGYLKAGASSWDRAVVGGPAVQLMPDYLADLPNVTIGGEMPGVLQRVNPQATRTTTGCIRKCQFCGIGTGFIEPGLFAELEDWRDLPVICDNNLLAASDAHFIKVIGRLQKHEGADFNQGLDARLLRPFHADLLRTLNKPTIRLALDSLKFRGVWTTALKILTDAGIPKSWVSSYALIAFDEGPEEAWERCEFIKAHGIRPDPMWFHGLDELKENRVSERQKELGWDHRHRTLIMGYWYKHRGFNPFR